MPYFRCGPSRQENFVRLEQKEENSSDGINNHKNNINDNNQQ